MKKECFPIFSHHPQLVYLDSAATTHKPKSVVEGMSHFFLEQYGTVHRAVYRLAAEATTHYELVREQVRAFLGAKDKEEIIYVRGATSGINLVAHSFLKGIGLGAGDEIAISETEHHANIVPWKRACEETGAVLRVIPVSETGEISLDAVETVLSSGRVKLLAIAYMANATGVIHKVKEVIQLAHRFGAKVLVDAAQMVAHYPIDVVEIDADFLVFSAHKMYGPTGIGILYGKHALLQMMPPYEGGGDMIRNVSFKEITYQDPPLKFEAGTPSIAEVIGLGQAIEFLQGIGWDTILEHNHLLMGSLISELSHLSSVNYLIPPSLDRSILTFTCEGCHPLDVGTLLDLRHIAVRTGHLCAQPALARFGCDSVIRISLGVYNTQEDVNRFVAALKEVLSVLSPKIF